MSIPPPHKGTRSSSRRSRSSIPPPRKVERGGGVTVKEALANLRAVFGEISLGESLLALAEPEDEDTYEIVQSYETALEAAKHARKFWDELAKVTKSLPSAQEGRVTRPRKIELLRCQNCASWWHVVSGRSKSYPKNGRYACRSSGRKGVPCPGLCDVMEEL